MEGGTWMREDADCYVRNPQWDLLKLPWCIKDVCDVLQFISNILEFFPSILEYYDCFLKFSDNYSNFQHFIKTFHCNIGCWPHCCDLQRNRSTMIRNVSEHCRKNTLFIYYSSLFQVIIKVVHVLPDNCIV